MSRLRHLARRLRRRALGRVFERSGETSDAVRLDEVGLAQPGYHDYEPSGWRSFRRAIKGVEISEDAAFLDIGCGKGRVLAQAARRPFGRVIGLELSPDLAEQARQLLDAERRRRRCGSVEIVVEDATRWTPPEDVSVVYVYNALSGASLRAMLDRVAESERRAPRRLLFLYVNPVHEEEIAAHPAFTLLERRGGRWAASDPRRVSIFAVGPDPHAGPNSDAGRP